jgi:hypothetical protein
MCRSVRQTPHAMTRTRTWRGPGSGMGRFRSVSWAAESSTIARIGLVAPEVQRVVVSLWVLAGALAGPSTMARRSARQRGSR